MKIIQALGWYFPESLGGTEVYVAGLCRRLRAAGHEVLVAAPDPGAREERRYEHDGVPVYRYPIAASPTRGECQDRVAVRGAERFHEWLRRERADVVHMHTFVTGMSLFEAKAAKGAGSRVIATTHSSSLGFVCARGTMMRRGEALCDGVCEPRKCAECELERRGLPRAAARAAAAIPPALGALALRGPGRIATALGMSATIRHNQSLQREMLATVDRFVLLTQWALDACLRNGAPREKLALNRLGMGQTRLPRKPGPEERPTRAPVKFGYVGRFDPIKGVRELGRAMASLPRELPIALEFRGPIKGAEDQKVFDELKVALGSDPRVTIAPPVSSEAIVDALAGYDVLCCPSACLEGGPTVAIEAHGVGTPVIGTRIGGLAEMVEEGVNGRLVAPGDWRALAEVMKEIALDPAGTIDKWRTRLPAARTMDEIAADYLALYAQAREPQLAAV